MPLTGCLSPLDFTLISHDKYNSDNTFFFFFLVIIHLDRYLDVETSTSNSVYMSSHNTSEPPKFQY